MLLLTAAAAVEMNGEFVLPSITQGDLPRELQSARCMGLMPVEKSS